jgi:hypothetical protein
MLAHKVVEMLRIPYFLNNRLTDGGEVVSLTCRQAGRPLPPTKITGTRFCLRLSRAQGHNVAGRIR